jgi:N6-L-threonylcarbamoyladenine synthase
MSIILAIESSCDETSASICINGQIKSNVIAAQSIHEKYGGVVPELASRAHMQNIVAVVEEALLIADTKIEDLDAVACTTAPGLIGALLVGNSFTKSIALANNIPFIAVHHMQAHVIANLIEEPQPNFPFLCLTVSGGHTQIVQCNSPSDLKILGQTIDDAAGEAFDKTAKIIGLPYPGGPLIDKYAKTGKAIYKFPEPRIKDLDFSFSGLKTAILYFLQNAGKSMVYSDTPLATEEERKSFIQDNLADICASVQDRIVSILLNKLEKAVNQTGIKTICIAGGVSANSGLRKSFTALGIKNGWMTKYPSIEYCTDNAAMIAMTAHFKFMEKDFSPLDEVPSARAEWN